MGTLKYAILGLLSRRSMTGYDMTREFETTLFELWSAKHSQIYPELRALTEQGLVEYKIEIAGKVLEKKLYSITEAGKNEFAAWEKSRCTAKPQLKDEFRLQLFFADVLSAEHRIELLSTQRKEHESYLKHLRGKLEAFEEIPPKGEAEFSDYLVLMGAVMREESACRWLEDSIRLCRERQ